MSIIDAKYEPFPIKAFRGNPLIEAIRPAMDINKFMERLTYRPELDADEDLDGFGLELSVELIDLTYIVPPELYALYKTILKNLIAGYTHRNPLTRDMKYQQFQSATNRDYYFPQTKNLSKVVSVIGLSGAGKTLSVRQCLSLVPQVIRHTEYHGQRLVSDQIVYLEFQAPVTRTTRGFVLSFFMSVDQLLQTNYYNQWKGKSISVPILIQEAKKVALNHHIGMAFIDEIQRCASSDAKTDYATLEFIDDFFNSVGIPLVVAGTYKAMPLFKTTMSTTRRLSSSRMFKFDVIENDLSNLTHEEGEEATPSFWSIFVDSFYFPSLLEAPTSFNAEFKEHVHFLTLGLPALAARLFRLAYEDAIALGYETITIELLNSVYHEQFELLHPAIESLRSGQYGGYEDLLPKQGVFKPTREQQVEQIIQDDIRYHERLSNRQQDDGEFIELEDIEQAYIPNEDIRNLKGLSTEELAAKLKAPK